MNLDNYNKNIKINILSYLKISKLKNLYNLPESFWINRCKNEFGKTLEEYNIGNIRNYDKYLIYLNEKNGISYGSENFLDITECFNRAYKEKDVDLMIYFYNINPTFINKTFNNDNDDEYFIKDFNYNFENVKFYKFYKILHFSNILKPQLSIFFNDIETLKNIELNNDYFKSFEFKNNLLYISNGNKKVFNYLYEKNLIVHDMSINLLYALLKGKFISYFEKIYESFDMNKKNDVIYELILLFYKNNNNNMIDYLYNKINNFNTNYDEKQKYLEISAIAGKKNILNEDNLDDFANIIIKNKNYNLISLIKNNKISYKALSYYINSLINTKQNYSIIIKAFKEINPKHKTINSILYLSLKKDVKLFKIFVDILGIYVVNNNINNSMIELMSIYEDNNLIQYFIRIIDNNINKLNYLKYAFINKKINKNIIDYFIKYSLNIDIILKYSIKYGSFHYYKEILELQNKPVKKIRSDFYDFTHYNYS